LKAASERAAKVASIRKAQKDYKKGKLKIIRAEKLIKQNRLKKVDRERIHNQKKKKTKTGQGMVVAAVRNGRMGGSKDVGLTLRDLGLTEQHTIVFLPNTKETAEKLHIIRPFVFWGPPSFKNVATIMQKKALFKDPKAPKRKTVLSDNTLVEKHLGDLGLLCTEDLSHAIFTNAKCFEQVTQRLWPVPLGDAKKAGGLVHDKDFTFGDLKANINNKLTQLMGS
jgi:large subunit ribosomal protein L7e